MAIITENTVIDLDLKYLLRKYLKFYTAHKPLHFSSSNTSCLKVFL